MPGAAGSRGDLAAIPEFVPTQLVSEGSIPLLEINLRVLGYQRGGLFIMSAVKLAHMLVSAVSRPLPGHYCVLLMHKQPVLDSSIAKPASDNK